MEAVLWEQNLAATRMDGAMIASVGAEINILSSKMPTDIHSPVQYANDRDLVIP